jgi:hypothetical protein
VATFTLTNAQITVGTIWTGTAPGPGNPTISGAIAVTNSTDFSCWTRQITLNHNVAMQDFSTFCSNGFVEQRGGIIGSDLSVEFNQDFAASAVDAVFWPLFINRTLTYLDIKPTSSARASTNPSYVYAAYVGEYQPITGAVGDRASVTIPFKVTGKFDRLTS